MAPLVALAGFMGSGKSSVGLLCARLLGWRFVDLDDEIAQKAGMPIARMFELWGEADFRRREVQALREVLAEEPAGGATEAGAMEGGPGLVLALGGGILETPEAATWLEDRGVVVFLDVDGDQAWERARGEARPLAQDRETFVALLEARRPTYQRVADWTLPVGRRSADEIARELAGLIQATGAVWPKSWGYQLTSTERRSTIVGGPGMLAALNTLSVEVSGRGSRLFVITDENVDAAWGQAASDLLPDGTAGRKLVLAPGEQSKNQRELERCWEWLASTGARRDDVVVALGGGVVGDLAGFAAATYQRGIGLWQVPTTLLAHVDSSVGGKTAINLQSGKNLVGAFYQPSLVLIDPQTLTTLPEAEFANGWGEVVKYGLLLGETLFGDLERDVELVRARDTDVLSSIVKACVRYKAQVVADDERDTGGRAVLNLGHTTAHALEVALGYGVMGHGEAVGLGLLVALALSERLLGLSGEVRPRVERLLAGLGLRTSIQLPSFASLRAAAARDKKVTARSAGFVGLRALGQPAWGLELPEGAFEEALEVIGA